MEVLDGVSPVLVFPPLRNRVREVVERRSHPPRHVETSGNTQRTDSVQAIAVLKDPGFEALGFEASGIAVGFHRVRHLHNTRRWPAHGSEDGCGLVCRQARRLATQRGVLLDRDTVVQHCGSEQHFEVTALCPLDALRVYPYAMDVREVVGAIVVVWWEMFQQLSGEVLERGESFAGHRWCVPFRLNALQQALQAVKDNVRKIRNRHFPVGRFPKILPAPVFRCTWTTWILVSAGRCQFSDRF